MCVCRYQAWRCTDKITASVESCCNTIMDAKETPWANEYVNMESIAFIEDKPVALAGGR